MRPAVAIGVALLLFAASACAVADTDEKVVEIPTRPGTTQRFLWLDPPHARAAVILFAGGDGALRIRPDGTFGWGRGNFLVRSRQLFAEQGLAAAVIDAPSDRQSPPYLSGFRQTSEHAADMKALIEWIRARTKLPVWLVGTSAGTQSAAHVATTLSGSAQADGVVLTSTVLTARRGRPVLAMPLEDVRIPILVVHHEDDGCAACPFELVPRLMEKLTNAPRKELVAFRGGADVGDPCEAFAHHGFNGLEREVVTRIAAWIAPKP